MGQKKSYCARKLDALAEEYYLRTLLECKKFLPDFKFFFKLAVELKPPRPVANIKGESLPSLLLRKKLRLKMMKKKLSNKIL